MKNNEDRIRYLLDQTFKISKPSGRESKYPPLGYNFKLEGFLIDPPISQTPAKNPEKRKEQTLSITLNK